MWRMCTFEYIAAAKFAELVTSYSPGISEFPEWPSIAVHGDSDFSQRPADGFADYSAFSEGRERAAIRVPGRARGVFAG